MLATWLLAASFALAVGASPVTAALLELLGPERAATLRQPPELESVSLALRPEEKAAAKGVLARLEAAGDVALLPDIARAYLLIGDFASAARLQPSLSGPAGEVQRTLALVRNGDYETAHAEALALNQKYPGRSDIASLLASTRGRSRGFGGKAAKTGTSPAPTTTPIEGKGVAFTEAPRRRIFADAPPEIDLSANFPDEPERRGNGSEPLWPLVPIGLLSAGGYAVVRRSKTFEAHDEAEESEPPSTTDRVLAGAVVAGLAGVAIYYAAASAVLLVPALTRTLNGGGQQVMRIVNSQAGAINPATPNAIQRGATLNNLNVQLTAQQISRGHSFAKHASEFGVKTPEEFARLIERALANPTMVRSLSRGRVAYWHQSSATVVIRDPAAVDGGTAFIPSRGVDYFYSLR